jgi:hypothetical protein
MKLTRQQQETEHQHDADKGDTGELPESEQVRRHRRGDDR